MTLPLPFSLDFISKISLSPDSVADLFFFVVVVMVAIVSVILFFHWKKYGLPGVTFVLAEVVYFTVAVVLLSIAFFSIN